MIILNNKSNLVKEEFIKYKNSLDEINCNEEIVLAPSSIYLGACNNKIPLCSQTVSSYEEGAHTGEVAATQLKSIGVKYCLVGHSERRNEEKESSQELNSKIRNLLANNIKVVLCVGETLRQKEAGIKEEVILKEIREATKNLKFKSEDLIVAYEPIWAIGSGKVPTIEEIEDIIRLIKNDLNVKVLYGGSVNEKNINNFKSPLLDGYLLGGISLDLKKLSKLIKEM